MKENRFVELAKNKESFIKSIDNQIRFEALQLIDRTLDNLGIEHKTVLKYMRTFEVDGVEFFLVAESGSYQVKLCVHNMIQEINLMNHEIGKSDRIGTGLDDYYFERILSNQIKMVCPSCKLRDDE